MGMSYGRFSRSSSLRRAFLAGVAVSMAAFVPWMVFMEAGIPIARLTPPAPPPFTDIALRNTLFGVLLASGRVTLGTTTIAGLLSLGFMLGRSVSDAYGRGAAATFIATATVPHGVFELSGLWLAAAVGLEGVAMINRPQSDSSVPPTVVLAAAGTLILLGAWTECFVTPRLLQMLAA
jgi:uncharacterized membrane protein SpoIIM required for sporulation